MSPEKPHDPEFERAREVLERTMRYLSKCAEDPVAGPGSDDPKKLIQDLQGLSVEPEPALDAKPATEPRTIQIRHRRSA
ncbi:MAG: hypothetical protein ABL998_00395 [Planctomycetota bacterium]